MIACAFASGAMVACFPQGACLSDPPSTEYCGDGDNTCEGTILDATHWQSGLFSGTWVNFSRERTVHMHFRDAKTGATLSGTVSDVQVFISVTSTLAQSPNQFVPCAGNNCEITGFDSSSIDLKNDTCADFFVNAVVTVTPNAPAADAGTE